MHVLRLEHVICRICCSYFFTDSSQYSIFISHFVGQSSIEVDVMPGEQDAGTCLVPQQPMHHALLPEAFQYSGIRTVCNPYEFCVDGVRYELCSVLYLGFAHLS